ENIFADLFAIDIHLNRQAGLTATLLLQRLRRTRIFEREIFNILRKNRELRCRFGILGCFAIGLGHGCLLKWSIFLKSEGHFSIGKMRKVNCELSSRRRVARMTERDKERSSRDPCV